MYIPFIGSAGNELLLELDIYQILASSPTSTSALIEISAGSDCQSFGYEIVQSNQSFANSFTFTNSNTFTKTGLIAGTEYKIQVRGHSGLNGFGTYSRIKWITFTMPSISSDASITNNNASQTPNAGGSGNPGTSSDNQKTVYNYYTGQWVSSVNEVVPAGYPPLSGDTGSISNPGSNAGNTTVIPDVRPSVDSIRKNIENTTRSFLKLNNDNPDTTAHTISVKKFTNLNTSQQYFSFGTSLFFESTINTSNQSGGIGFFVNNLGKDGYFIKVRTTASAATAQQKEFSIVKVKGGNEYRLTDSQVVIARTLTGIFASKFYKLDVKVKKSTDKVEITVYVNGFKITATDKNPTVDEKKNGAVSILPVTNTVGLFCQEGVVNFDYVYGLHMTEAEYNKDDLFNLYDGQFTNATMSFLYGNVLLENDSRSTSTIGGFLEEFGPVVREIKYLNVKYDSRPAFPMYTSVGINPFVKILGERLTSFGGKIYIANSTGTTVPLDDGNSYSFYIIGKYINQSAAIEYINGTASDFDIQEPVTFESSWIQRESDAKTLGDWVQNIWSKKNVSIRMNVFGNPLLSVSDIITINYPANDLYHTGVNAKKFVITNVSQEFKEGLSTTITARTL